MGRIEWDVNDCMQSRQDYMAAFQKKRRDTSHEDDSSGDAETRRVCGVEWRSGLSWQHVGDACGSLRTYEARRFGLAAWQEVR